MTPVEAGVVKVAGTMTKAGQPDYGMVVGTSSEG
jgi:hypothetical protein